MVYNNHIRFERRSKLQNREYTKLNKNEIKETYEIAWNLINEWRGRELENQFDIIFIFSRALIDNPSKYELLQDDKSIKILFERIDSKYKDYILETRERLSEEQLQHLVINFDISELDPRFSGITIGKEVINLVYKLLEITNRDNILQLYPIHGNFLIDYIENFPNSDITTISLNTNNIIVSKIRASLLYKGKSEVKIIQQNYLNADLSNYNYNKVFAIPPFSARLRGIDKEVEDEELLKIYMDNEVRVYDDWIYILKLIASKKFEKALFILPSGLLFSQKSINIRKYLVSEGYIEAIVELPEKIFKETSISTNAIIISKNNKKVKMIDVSNLYVRDRFINKIDEKNLAEILKAYSEESDISKNVGLEDIERNDFNLLPRRYTNDASNIENYYYLKDIAEIKRGYANIKKSDLDDRITDKETNNKILTAGDIGDEFYVDELTNLKNIKENEEIYSIENEDIVMVRAGNYKSMIIRDVESKNIITNGTIYTIRPNKEKINPYYLQMYLSSNHCQSQIEALTGGTVISFIGIRELKQLKIPKVSKELEKSLAEQYKTILDRKEIIKMQKKILDEETDNLISGVV